MNRSFRTWGGLMFAATIVVLGPATPASADWVVTQLTDDYLRDEPPRTSDGNITWRKKAEAGTSNFAIWFHDGSDTRPLTAQAQQGTPEISGSWVTWYEYFPPGEAVIYLYDENTDTADAITCRDGSGCVNDGRDHDPVISGEYIAWIDGTYNTWVEFYDGATVTRIDETWGGGDAHISGSSVVWSRDGNIYLYTGTLPAEMVSPDGGTHPRICGSNVVWEQWIPQPVGGSDLYLYDGTSVRRIATGGWNQNARVSETHVVYEMAGPYIGVYDIDAGTTLQLGILGSRNPDISGDIVVWDHGDHVGDIYAYDMGDGSTTNVTNNANGNRFPRISGTTVTWQARPDPYDHRTFEVYKAVLQPANQPPTADAGENQSIHPGMEATLDGSGSSDPDEDYPLTYSWQITSKPDGSTAVLSGPDAVNPSFIADLFGDYTIELLVTDSEGAVSEPDSVVISTWNTAPVADAGEDQAVIELGTVVQLGTDEGRQSYDQDGDPITYLWALDQKPDGSSAELDAPTSSTPTFVADVQGEYVITLEVEDPWASSEPDSVTVSFNNVKPVAVPGGNQSVMAGDTVWLDGSASYDVNLDLLTFAWSIVSKPEGSQAQLSDPEAVQTSFEADLAGTYVVSLVVNDGSVDSDPANVTIESVSFTDVVGQVLRDAVTAINDLPPGSLKNKNMKNTLTIKINAALGKIDAGVCGEALNKLGNDIVAKTDGCANAGGPDQNDWLITWEAQAQVYPLLADAIGLLENGDVPCYP